MRELFTFVHFALTTFALVAAPTANEDFVVEEDAKTYTNAVAAATAYTDAQIRAIPSPDFSPSNATLVATIEEVAPAPGNYSVVSNKAMTALQSYTETDPTIKSWAKAASKPTYTLNEVAPNSENWLGVQGNAGRHIKVLAGTAGGQIVGGMRITASTQNDNNMTTYTYGGVAVKRSGVNTDYLWDVSSQSGIVRRSELAAITPGDYATVSNRAVNSVQKSDIPEYTETNAVSTIVWHYGAETLAIPSGGTLSASTTGWKNGESMFLVLSPSGSYTVDANAVDLVGYNAWPTNTTLCVAFRYGSKILVNPITATE